MALRENTKLPEAYWEETPKKKKKPKMLLAHFMDIELGALDVIQGGIHTDPETGFKEYSALDRLLKKPEIKEKMIEVMRPLMEGQKHEGTAHKIDQSYKKDLHFLKKSFPKAFKKLPIEKKNPAIHAVEEEGTGHDDRLAWIPESFVELALDVGYQPKFNPHTGLLMFGFFDFIARPFKEVGRFVGKVVRKPSVIVKPLIKVAAGIAGAALAPATGGASAVLLPAALGGTGAYVAGRAMGEKHKEALKGGLGGALGGIGSAMAPSLGINASLGAGLGQTSGQLLGGAKPKEALTAGALHGVGHYGMSKLNEAGKLPTWLGGKAAPTPAQAAREAYLKSEGVSSAVPSGTSSGTAGAAAIPSAAGPSALSSWILPAALTGGIGALTYKAHKQQEKKHDQFQNKVDVLRKEALKELKKEKQDMGFGEKIKTAIPDPMRIRRNPHYGKETQSERESGLFELPWLEPNEEVIERAEPLYAHVPGACNRYAEGGDVHHDSSLSWDKTVIKGLDSISNHPDLSIEPKTYAKGGLVHHHPYHDQKNLQSITEGVLIKGPGKGQQDLIATTVPEDSYIIDASTTSMLGDGSSDAGAHVLKEFEEDIKKRVHPQKKMIIAEHLARTKKQLPVYLSDSEYKFDPLTVKLLGDGSEVQGSKMLKTMVKNIRKEKSKSAGGLPIKAKSPWDYIEEGRR